MYRAGLKVGDKVICVASGVRGTIEKFYRPTGCTEQTMVRTDDGRLYHAPTWEWRKIIR